MVKKTISQLRNEQYLYNIKMFPLLNNWKTNPYTFIKARFYMEISSVLVYLLLKTNIRPNTITILYGAAGILTGFLLAINNNYTICIGVFIAFTKGILDWSDGHFARITGQTSLTGHILDIYGAFLNSLGLQIGLGLYIANNTDSFLFYYMVLGLLFFRMANLYEHSKLIIINEVNLINNKQRPKDGEIKDEAVPIERQTERIPTLYEKLSKSFFGFFDDRARSVDFICLIILLELFGSIELTPIIFLLIFIKHFIIFSVSFFKVAKSGWAENYANVKLEELNTIIKKNKV